MRIAIMFVIGMFIGFLCLYPAGIILDTTFTSLEGSATSIGIGPQYSPMIAMMGKVFQIIAGIMICGAIAVAVILVFESKGFFGGGQYQ